MGAQSSAMKHDGAPPSVAEIEQRLSEMLHGSVSVVMVGTATAIAVRSGMHHLEGEPGLLAVAEQHGEFFVHQPGGPPVPHRRRHIVVDAFTCRVVAVRYVP